MSWGKFVSMELDDEDKMDLPMVASKRPDYPYGLRISLGDAELKKLGLDFDECEIGCVLDFRAMATVTSKSCNEGDGMDKCCRIELQIERMTAEPE